MDLRRGFKGVQEIIPHNNTPALIFGNEISQIAIKNRDACKIEILNCWIVPGQLKVTGNED